MSSLLFTRQFLSLKQQCFGALVLEDTDIYNNYHPTVCILQGNERKLIQKIKEKQDGGGFYSLSFPSTHGGD